MQIFPQCYFIDRSLCFEVAFPDIIALTELHGQTACFNQ